jgi:hypothetical protein
LACGRAFEWACSSGFRLLKPADVMKIASAARAIPGSHAGMPPRCSELSGRGELNGVMQRQPVGAAVRIGRGAILRPSRAEDVAPVSIGRDAPQQSCFGTAAFTGK